MVGAPTLLKDMTVLELGTGVAVAAAGKLLAEAGASVRKLVATDDPVELDGPFARAADGARVSLLAADLHFGKTMERLDDHGPDAIDGADVIIAGGTLPWGLDAAGLFAQAGGPAGGRIVAVLTPYGLTGPRAGDRGTDLTAAAAGGFLHMIGEPDRPPLTLGGYQADRSQGASAFTAIMVACFARDASGEGNMVDVSAVETIAYMEWKADIYAQADGKPRSRGAASQWFDLNCVDGPLCFIYENPDWPKIVSLVGGDIADARFASRDGRLALHAEAEAILQHWVGGMTKSEAYHLLQGAGIPVGMVATMSDIDRSGQYRDTAFFTEAETPDLGIYRRPGAAWTFDGRRPSPGGRS